MSYIEIHLWDDWYDSVYEDFLQILEAAGVSATADDLSFTGFHSQGDGARFLGNFYLNEVDTPKLRELLPEEDKYLADDLQELAAKHPEIQGRITQCGSGFYYHSHTMHIGEYSSNLSFCDEYTEAFEEDEVALEAIFRKLADVLYSQLEEDYEFQIASETCHRWDQSLDEIAQRRSEMEELQESFKATPPADKVQVDAIRNQLLLLEYAIESAKREAKQLADQFHYWVDGKSISIGEFHEKHF